MSTKVEDVIKAKGLRPHHTVVILILMLHFLSNPFFSLREMTNFSSIMKWITSKTISLIVVNLTFSPYLKPSAYGYGLRPKAEDLVLRLRPSASA